MDGPKLVPNRLGLWPSQFRTGFRSVQIVFTTTNVSMTKDFGDAEAKFQWKTTVKTALDLLRAEHDSDKAVGAQGRTTSSRRLKSVQTSSRKVSPGGWMSK